MLESQPDAHQGRPDRGRLAHPLALTQGSALAKVEPPGIAPRAMDYLPVDNHRALLRHWQALHPVQQLIIGSGLGMALGTAMMAQITQVNARPAIAFAPSAVNHGPTARLTQATVKALVYRLQALPSSTDLPTVAIPAPGGQPWLHPVMVDRFYIPTAPRDGIGDGAPSPLVVDRFYFDPSAWGQPDHPAPEIALAQNVVEVSPPARIPPPPPPPWEQPAVIPPAAPQATGAAEGLPLPAPPPSVPKVHRLIGVVKTGRFAAALVQTEQNSYAVTLGDRVSQSAWQLVEVLESSVVLSDGQQRLALHVGDAF